MEYKEFLDEMKKIEEALQNPYEFLDFLTMEIKEKHIEHVMRETREEGNLEVREEGKEEIEIEMIRKLKNAGVPIDTIVVTSGLCIPQIEKL